MSKSPEMIILPIKTDVHDFGSLSFLQCRKFKLPKTVLIGKMIISLLIITYPATKSGSPLQQQL